MLVVCGWAEYNASLIAAWNNGKKGGRKTQQKPVGSKMGTQQEPVGSRVEKSREEKRRIQEPTHTGNSNSLALPPPFDSQPVLDAFTEWFAYLSKRNKQPFDPGLTMAKSIQFFETPQELTKSIDYAIANQYITLKNYAAEASPRNQSGDATGAEGVVGKALDSLDAEMRAEEAKQK